MNNYTIYIHRNKINNKAYCQTSSKRWGKDGNRYSHSPHLAAAISKACRGQLKTYKGYHWRYADEHKF